MFIISTLQETILLVFDKMTKFKQYDMSLLMSEMENATMVHFNIKHLEKYG